MRSTVVMGLALACVLAACGKSDDASQTARRAEEATQVTVESAPQAGSPSDGQASERTQVTVESAEPGKKPGDE